MVVPMLVKSCSEEVIGKFDFLFETIYTFVNLEVYPSVGGKVGEVVFADEFMWDD